MGPVMWGNAAVILSEIPNLADSLGPSVLSDTVPFPVQYPGAVGRCTFREVFSVSLGTDHSTRARLVLDYTRFWGVWHSPSTRLVQSVVPELLRQIPGDATRVIVLVTAGLPTCGPTYLADPSDPPECPLPPELCRPQSVLQVFAVSFLRTLLAESAARGVLTMVIGFENDPRTQVLGGYLNDFAVAGAMPRVDAGRPRYYSIESAAEILRTREAVLRLRDCRLAPAVRVANTDGLVVRLSSGGADFRRDTTHATGWDWLDAELRTVELHGEACARVRAGETAEFYTGDTCVP